MLCEPAFSQRTGISKKSAARLAKDAVTVVKGGKATAKLGENPIEPSLPAYPSRSPGGYASALSRAPMAKISRASSMRKKGRSNLHEGENAGIQNPFQIAGRLGIARDHTGLGGVTGPQPFRLWDAWRYAYLEARPTKQTLLIE